MSVRLRSLTLVIFTTFVLLTTFGLSLAQGNKNEFKINRACDTDSDLKLTKIVKTKDSIVLYLTFTNNSEDEDYPIRLFPPGNRSAFYLADADTKTKYRLKSTSGVAVSPNTTMVHKGQSQSFSLTFVPLPNSVKTINVIEGEHDASDGMIFWRFMNVHLRNGG